MLSQSRFSDLGDRESGREEERSGLGHRKGVGGEGGGLGDGGSPQKDSSPPLGP